MNKHAKGFTLIELIVVIAIIGVLATVLIITFNPLAQLQKARDAQRRSDMKAIQNALEQYYNDHGSYPTVPCAWYASESDATGPGWVCHSGGDWIPGLAPQYMKSLPKDPSGGSNGTGCKTYLYYSNGAGYALLAHCSAESPNAYANQKDAFYDPVRPTWAWKVCAGAGCDW